MDVVDQKLNSNYRNNLIYYGRYIDDIFGIFQGSQEQFQDFIKEANIIMPNIKLNFEANANNVEFLDLNIYQHDKIRLGYNLHFKTGNAPGVTHKQSYTSKASKTAIITAQINRIIDKSFTYPNLRHTMQFYETECISKGYTKREFKILKRKAITHFNLKTEGEEELIMRGLYPCNRCNICQYVKKHGIHKINNKYHNSHGCYDCQTEGVIYGITCRKCQLWYIGETTGKAKKRIQQHVNNLKNNSNGNTNTQILYAHFNNNTDCRRSLQYTILKKINKGHIHKIMEIESNLMNRYNTIHPNGLNTRCSTNTHQRYSRVAKLPYGVKTPMALGNRYVKTGFKNLARLYHTRKFKLNIPHKKG